MLKIALYVGITVPVPTWIPYRTEWELNDAVGIIVISYLCCTVVGGFPGLAAGYDRDRCRLCRGGLLL